MPVNIGNGDQFKPEFLAISPNNRMPAIVDRRPADGGAPISVFESGAILVYLAEKTGRFLPDRPARPGRGAAMAVLADGRARPDGRPKPPFLQYAPEKIPYAIDATSRRRTVSMRVLDKRLAGREFVAGPYSIADMACYPWIVPYERQGQKLEDFPHLKRWFEVMQTRLP